MLDLRRRRGERAGRAGYRCDGQDVASVIGYVRRRPRARRPGGGLRKATGATVATRRSGNSAEDHNITTDGHGPKRQSATSEAGLEAARGRRAGTGRNSGFGGFEAWRLHPRPKLEVGRGRPRGRPRSLTQNGPKSTKIMSDTFSGVATSMAGDSASRNEGPKGLSPASL